MKDAVWENLRPWEAEAHWRIQQGAILAMVDAFRPIILPVYAHKRAG